MALKGVKVIEMAGLAPVPFCGMLLSDFGAKVIRVDRARASNPDTLSRGKLSISLDLKQKEAGQIMRKLSRSADVLIEPYRAGVMERLGLGPQDLMKDNPGLIYARLTGYGQDGPMAHRAGHDINYLAISGLLSRLGRQGQPPHAPINLLADFAGGGLICAFGIVMALYERTRSGKGQVIDANMVEGASYVGSFVWQMLNSPIFTAQRGEGWLDGGAPFYDTFRTKDDKYMAVGALEGNFYKNLIKGLGFTPEEAVQFEDWTLLRRKFSERFLSRTQAEWCSVFDDVDACVTPVLTTEEATRYPHNVARSSFDAVTYPPAPEKFIPKPAPRLASTPVPNNIQPDIGEHSFEVLKEIGYTEEQCQALESDGVVEQAGTTAKL